ncbi:hypothetical protein CCP1ISM_9210001 [Azospirillaceae bacterium]
MVAKPKITAAKIRATVETALDQFLHPLTGKNGQGWDFGERPHRSNLISMIEGLDGVDYVQRLSFTESFDGLLMPRNFLVYSGQHTVAIVATEGR